MGNFEYTLVYFNVRVLGEPIRQIFTYLDVPFKDSKVDTAKWDQLRKNHKWHSLPELHVTDKNTGESFCLTQSAAICRYIANSYPKSGLMPKAALERARCDQIVDVVQDMRLKMKPYLVAKLYGIDPDKKGVEAIKTQLLEKDDFLLYLENLEELLDKDGPFILGKEASWADFFLANFTSIWEQVLDSPLLLDNYLKLKKQQEAVTSLPKIKQWIEQREKSIC